MHSIPGGVCTSLKRKGCTFDGCIHHLAGCRPGTRVHRIWQELGAMPRPVLYPAEIVQVEAPTGRSLTAFVDLALRI
jgi:phytoene dehydrogenase-like protein